MTFNMPRYHFVRIFPERSVPRKTFYSCDYCVNKYGTDLCGCGSGRKWGTCTEDYDECAFPLQQMPYAWQVTLGMITPTVIELPEEPVLKPFKRRQRVQVQSDA